MKKFIKFIRVLFTMGMLSMVTACSARNNEESIVQSDRIEESKNNELEISQNEMVETSQKLKNKTDTTTNKNPYEMYNNNPIFSENFIYYYICSGKLDLPDFSGELRRLEQDLEKAENKGNEKIYVDKMLWGYRQAYNENAYLYSGQIKDGKPHGVGTVYERISSPDFDDLYLKVYQGYFDQGKYDEFGVSYTVAYKESLDVIFYIANNFNEEYEKYIPLFYNPVSYIGEYKSGDRHGKGISLQYPENKSADYLSGKYTIQNVAICAGTFKKDNLSKGKKYLHEYLLYEGEFNNEKKDGKGKLYYQNTNSLAFDGIFKKDEVKEGTLYDPEGNVICKGKWKNEICGIIDFYDVYYQFSDIGARDMEELFGDEYRNSQFLQYITSQHEEKKKEENRVASAEIDYSNGTGNVSAQTNEEWELPVSSGTDLYVVNCNASITLREAPSRTSQEVTQIPLYSSVQYIDTAQDGFCKISYYGQTGYVLQSYLDVYEPQVYTGIQCMVVNCRESITLRTSISSNDKELCQIPLGATVDYIDSAADGYCLVNYNGIIGYVKEDYLAF